MREGSHSYIRMTLSERPKISSPHAVPALGAEAGRLEAGGALFRNWLNRQIEVCFDSVTSIIVITSTLSSCAISFKACLNAGRFTLLY